MKAIVCVTRLLESKEYIIYKNTFFLTFNYLHRESIVDHGHFQDNQKLLCISDLELR